MKDKVFCIGIFKSGTKSMAQVFKRLGYKVSIGHEPSLGPFDDKGVLNHSYESSRETWTYPPQLFQVAERYDAFHDAPWIFCYDIMSEKYPTSKFILTQRTSPRKVALSTINQSRLRITEDNIKRFVDRQMKHDMEVMDFFMDKKDRLLIYDWDKEKDISKIAKFLGQPKVNFNKPHANRGRYK